MQRRILVGITAAVAVAAGLTAVVTSAQAAPPATGNTNHVDAHGVDDLPSPAEEKRRALRQEALADVISGERTTEQRGSSTVVNMGKKSGPTTKDRANAGQVDQYVELSREKTDNIFVVLAEFGNERHPDFPDQDTDPDTPGPTTFEGPVRNQIPEPDRSVDNSTIWQQDYSQQHYQDLYFSTDPKVDSVANYYSKQSSGRYSVQGTVTNWAKVKYNEARYGRSNGSPCEGNVCNNSYELVKDGVNQWYADQLAQGKTPEELKAELARYDVWDRGDFDGDGNFDEADGYIDHFQIVHAGGDQADGDPHQGEDALWSHRAFAFSNTSSGPDGNLQGGAQVGGTGLWVGDYTMQPENGGIGVFAHEYGHDLGLPDLYDTAGGANNVNWWSLMAQQRVSADGEPIGFRVNDMDPWSKLQLGWLDYETVVAGQSRSLELGPHEYNSDKPQAVAVVLPDKEVTFDWGKPFEGANQWWSTKGDDLDTTLTRTVDLTGKTSAALSLKARYDIEAEYDYLYVQASKDGGQSWASLDGTANGQPFQSDSNGEPALSSSSEDKWVDMNVPLDSVVGGEVQLRFRYRTDGGMALNGFFADSLAITADGQPIFTDDAEQGDNGWTLGGFRTTTGTETEMFDNFYLASNRTYESYDQYMKTGPYNFGDPSRPDWAEHFPYQTGLGVWYWDTSQPDNNTSVHPGQGLALPIDAHPAPIYNMEGDLWRERIAGYDAPFSLSKADSFTLSVNGKPSYIRGQDPVPVFDDTGKFWYQEQPGAGVKLPATGTTITVTSQEGTSMGVDIGTK